MSTRRHPETKDNKPPPLQEGEISYYSQTLPPYKYLITVRDTKILNGDWTLQGLEKVKVFETKFESTALVLGYGGSMFFGLVTPDSTFDRLKDDFNYALLGIVVVVITVSEIT